MPGFGDAFWDALLLCQVGALFTLFMPGAAEGRVRSFLALISFAVTVLISLFALRHNWIDILVVVLAASTGILWLPAAQRQMTDTQKADTLRRTPGMIGVLCLFDVAFVPHGSTAAQQSVAFTVMVVASFLILYVLITGQIRKIRAAKKR